ncbi:50S ribosomal protein L35, partial [Treponema pedis]
YKQMNKGHIMTKKAQKRKRHLKKTAILSDADSMKMRKQLLPYG